MPYKDPEARRAAVRAYYQKNKVTLNKARRTRYENNREHFIELSKANEQRNKRQRNEYRKTRVRNHKLKAIEYLGGSCQRCGGKFDSCVYDFHHKHPSEKEFEPSVLLNYTWDRIQEELDKCLLLCSNCHRITHWVCEETVD